MIRRLKRQTKRRHSARREYLYSIDTPRHARLLADAILADLSATPPAPSAR